MNYRYEQSLLGFGCMRFPKKGNGFDLDEIRREIGYAVEHGVNYFDTAYIYSGSEEVLGTVLKELQLRERVRIATKLPQYLMKTPEEAEKNFREQLRRLRTDYIDNFLMHMLPDTDTLNVLRERGILTWVEEKKRAGAIRSIGFSYHGSTQAFQTLLHAYDWDFCQIQYNYLDVRSQAGEDGLRAAAEKGIPVIVMEPLRGGKLADRLPDAVTALFRKAHPDWSNAEWSFRWLYDQPAVTTVLSGMNSMEMLTENIRIASLAPKEMLSEADLPLYDAARAALVGSVSIPCTGCNYCMPCPFGVDIPGCFRSFNASYQDGYTNAFREYFMCTSLRKQRSNASVCKDCGQCEKKCPQRIEIRNELKRVKKRFENPLYHIGYFMAKLLRII